MCVYIYIYIYIAIRQGQPQPPPHAGPGTPPICKSGSILLGLSFFLFSSFVYIWFGRGNPHIPQACGSEREAGTTRPGMSSGLVRPLIHSRCGCLRQIHCTSHSAGGQSVLVAHKRVAPSPVVNPRPPIWSTAEQGPTSVWALTRWSCGLNTPLRRYIQPQTAFHQNVISV